MEQGQLLNLSLSAWAWYDQCGKRSLRGDIVMTPIAKYPEELIDLALLLVAGDKPFPKKYELNNQPAITLMLSPFYDGYTLVVTNLVDNPPL